MRTTVSPDYEHIRGFIASVPRLFDRGEGTLLFSGRNEVRLFRHGDVCLVAKRFKRHDIVKQAIYTFFRKDKARRAFENAAAIRARGFDTPAPIAYIEDIRGGMIRQVYYICEYTDMRPVRDELIEKEPYNARLAAEYARFVASLHQSGILHRDLNSTNTLYRCDGNGYRFQLIDINRMTFYDGKPVPKAERMENLTLLWRPDDMYMDVLEKYAAACGWTPEDIDRAVYVKLRHDRRWTRRKKFTGGLKGIGRLFRRLFGS